MEEPTPKMVQSWKAIYDTFHSRLNPNKKSGSEIVSYLTRKYPAISLTDTKIRQVVTDNVLLNECNARNIPTGKTPVVLAYLIENAGMGISLYDNQDEIFLGTDIIVGFELESGFFMVEGSSQLWDELFAFRGLDVDDLSNTYLVAEYITCLKKFGMLDSVLV
jgi:hypothetical protein